MNQNKKFLTFKSEFNKFLSLQIPDSNEICHQAIKYAISNGGKRIRAYLLFVLGKHFGISKNNLNILGASVELIHAYSLVHDDLPCMDDDVLRRGKLTCHKKYNEAQALLVGDALQSLSFELLSSKKLKIDPKLKIECINLLASSIGAQGMVLGQSLDMIYENKKPTKKIIEKIHKKKTGMLISACILIPSVISQQTNSIHKNLIILGENLGLLYQMVDDYLDATSDLEKLGKNPGKDFQRKKATYFSLYGKEKLLNVIDTTKDEIDKISLKLKLPNEFNFLINSVYDRIK
ncbi:MAG: polyprenyl synthetase family protein [Betaproteobacteria bacterium]|nr:polyprenyl synthetase family protein [Betaproteobacteria bacterium]